MKIKPKKSYYNLSPAEASAVAMALTKEYGDWDIFREWTGRYETINAKRKARLSNQLTLV